LIDSVDFYLLKKADAFLTKTVCWVIVLIMIRMSQNATQIPNALKNIRLDGNADLDGNNHGAIAMTLLMKMIRTGQDAILIGSVELYQLKTVNAC
jgi:hypothetical protein